MSEIRSVVAPELPPANGHYAQGIVHGDVVYVSGQLGRGPTMSAEEAGDITVQARRSLAAVAAILKAAGSDVSRLLKVNLYITDIAHWPAVDAEYRLALGAHRPARAIITAPTLHFGALIEVDGIAALR